MAKKYREVPSNFKDFENYLIYKKQEVVDAFFKGEKYFFYDTCSILHHSNTENRHYIIEFLKSKSATIIITRTVLMELTANSSELHQIQINFLKELYDNGLYVLLFDEEIILACLKEILNITIEEANKLLGFAVKEVSKFKTKTYEVLNSMDEKVTNKLKSIAPGKSELYSSFFGHARSLKEEGDSMAEELIFICIIVLTKIPLGKYILISDDLRIRHQVISIKEYIKKHHNVSEPYQLTTATLLYKMYKEGIISNRNDMIDIISKSSNGNINVYFVSEYDIKQEKNSFTAEELVDRLINENEFRIIY
ncbi:MAG: hypothetical protein PWQ96_401 [Clostridia bacterium]|jgi:hypothetical protein|nr:hypothetical protein [Clostridia bacterium]